MCRPLAALLLSIACTSLHAQVNTEVMRRSELTPGWTNRVAVSMALASGNTQFLKLGLSARSDVLAGRWYSFLVGNYERGVSGDELFVNKGFVHLRGVHSITPQLAAEAFAQKEFNEFLRLKDRNLAGVGARIRLLHLESDTSAAATLTADVGLGGMYEHEATTGAGAGVIGHVRSTNYLSLRWVHEPILAVSLIGYYQPAIADLTDFRVLSDITLSLSITDRVAWTSSLGYRFDNQPPPDLRPYDLDLKNGLAITF